MPTTKTTVAADTAGSAVWHIFESLQEFRRRHGSGAIDVVQESPHVIHVRVIDGLFEGMSRLSRHELLYDFLYDSLRDRLGENDLIYDVYTFLPLAPSEKGALHDQLFDGYATEDKAIHLSSHPSHNTQG